MQETLLHCTLTTIAQQQYIMNLEAYTFGRTLGEGGQGVVRLAVHKQTKEAAAVKINTNPKTSEEEARIHKMLKHQNVIKFFGNASIQNKQCIVLEFAPGGSLADRIQPHGGLRNDQASHRYFKQLLAGTEYLHEQSIVHRDIKPDNLLIDADDNLKISDFGLAAVFRHQGKEQQKNEWCGTLSYMAPEIIQNQPYQAQPVDVWSCGIVLVMLLTGSLPWDIAQRSSKCNKYATWTDGVIYYSPWEEINKDVLPLLQAILEENPAKRATIKTIKEHQWISNPYVKSNIKLSDCEDLKLRPRDLFLACVALFFYLLFQYFK